MLLSAGPLKSQHVLARLQHAIYHPTDTDADYEDVTHARAFPCLRDLRLQRMPSKLRAHLRTQIDILRICASPLYVCGLLARSSLFTGAMASASIRKSLGRFR